MKTTCDDCGSSDLVATSVASRGGHGPDLLPGTGWLSHAEFDIQICLQCGRAYWWVQGENLDKVRQSKRFMRRSE